MQWLSVMDCTRTIDFHCETFYVDRQVVS